MADDGVSSVIGTIILVAVAVVLAATLWAVLSSGDKEAFDPPTIAFREDPTGPGGRLIVVSVAGDEREADWTHISFGPATTASCTLPSGTVHAGNQVVCDTEGHIVLLYALEAGETFLLYEGDLR